VFGLRRCYLLSSSALRTPLHCAQKERPRSLPLPFRRLREEVEYPWQQPNTSDGDGGAGGGGDVSQGAGTKDETPRALEQQVPG
jgi:hypothetical protein